jgi:hypothetical protein
VSSYQPGGQVPGHKHFGKLIAALVAVAFLLGVAVGVAIAP